MRREFWLAVVCLAVASLPQAAGQFAGALESLISRPSERSASVYIGGDYTRTSRAEGLLATRRDVALLDQDQFEYSRTRRGHYRGRVLPISEVGLSSELSGPAGWPTSVFADRTGDLALVSGLQAATNFRLPLPGVGAGGLPALNAHIYTPHPPQTEFERFFGLVPAQPPAASSRRPFTSIAAELERQTQERVARAREAGLALLKAATVESRDPQTGRYPNCVECDAKLWRAARTLALVRDLDDADALPLILLTHIALEQESPSLAGTYLMQAFRRNPELFREQPAELAKLFGDFEDNNRSLVLEAQLHRYKDIGMYNPGSVAAQLVSGYCAWRLGDTSQARAAAGKALELARTNPEEAESALSFATALQAALP